MTSIYEDFVVSSNNVECYINMSRFIESGHNEALNKI